jgi:hypothetical protein
MTDPSVPDEADGGSTLLSVLAEAAEAGFSDQIMVTDEGELRCTKCDTTVAVADFEVEGFQRLEGASDPSDMLIVIWGTCAGCGRGGVATIGYGPNAGPADSKVLDALDLDRAPDDAGSAAS